MPAASHDGTTTQRLDCFVFRMRVRRAGNAAGMQGRGDLERREGDRRKIGPEAFRSADPPTLPHSERELRRDLAVAWRRRGHRFATGAQSTSLLT